MTFFCAGSFLECVRLAEESVDAEGAGSGEFNLVTRPHNEELCVKAARGGAAVY